MQNPKPRVVALSPYSLLGISPSSSIDEVRVAYKKRCLETHPDKGGDPDEFRRVQKAYEDVCRSQTTQAALPPRDRTRSPPRFNVGVVFSQTERLPKVKKKEPSFQEDVQAAFTSFPTSRVADNKSDVRQGQSFAAKVTVEASAVNRQRNKVCVAKLWDKLTKMTPQKRSEATLKLKKDVKAELNKYLQQRKSQRSKAPPAKGMPAGDSTSDESSSSSDSSTDDEQIPPSGGTMLNELKPTSSTQESSKVFKKIKPKASNGKVVDLDS